MAEFGETTIGNTSPQKPEREKINLGNVQLSDNKQQIDLDETRVKLFSFSIYCALGILVFIVITLLLSVAVYLHLLVCPMPNNPIPSNFWHIPLLLAFMASTILSVILTLTARFGEKRKPNDEGSETPIKALIDGVKEIKNLLQDFISSKP